MFQRGNNLGSMYDGISILHECLIIYGKFVGKYTLDLPCTQDAIVANEGLVRNF